MRRIELLCGAAVGLAMFVVVAAHGGQDEHLLGLAAFALVTALPFALLALVQTWMSRAAGIATLTVLGAASLVFVLIAADGMEGERGLVGAIVVVTGVAGELLLVALVAVLDGAVRWASRRAGARR